MSFKVGDEVIVYNRKNNYTVTKNGYKGQIVRIDDYEYYIDDYYLSVSKKDCYSPEVYNSPLFKLMREEDGT